MIRVSRSGPFDFPDTLKPEVLNQKGLQTWTEQAKRKAIINGSSGRRDPGNLTGRTRRYVRAIETELKAWGAILRVKHPGALLLEYGGDVEPDTKKALAFRLYMPSDTSEPTGPWIVAKKVTITARHIIGRAGDDATEMLPRIFEGMLP